ncbi:glycerophosphoryl diester phosphodiesterase [Crossiella equi]|uniref:Glycerophosphoryl diester phosphodiesterase n=1 Tax=Crossiella equi TaxID=130796 RepID=A0ABS5AQI6_9PSEU|nr:glycerophosphodiester phosphodiesterase family protein [Crossiella equi]MBP2478701.1 glycerophosphoryl diester phosphodiesterase [Crossiella equi]
MVVLPQWLTAVPIAHRGLHDNAAGVPENSLAAFEAAIRQGFPCELDVRLSADEQLVVIHDADLGRLTGTPGAVRQHTAAALGRVSLLGTGHGVPTLAEVLDLVDGRVPLLVETKHAHPLDGRGIERALLSRLSGYRGEVAVHSFDPVAVLRLRRLGARCPLGQISGLLRSADPVSRIIGRSMITNFLTRPDFVSYELDGLPCAAVACWRRRGCPVLAWPVCSAAQARRAHESADNIIFSGFVPDSEQ